jgi:hypothetical protein
MRFIFMQMGEPLPAGSSLPNHHFFTNNYIDSFLLADIILVALNKAAKIRAIRAFTRERTLRSVRVDLYFRCPVYLYCNIFLQHRS